MIVTVVNVLSDESVDTEFYPPCPSPLLVFYIILKRNYFMGNR